MGSTIGGTPPTPPLPPVVPPPPSQQEQSGGAGGGAEPQVSQSLTTTGDLVDPPGPTVVPKAGVHGCVLPGINGVATAHLPRVGWRDDGEFSSTRQSNRFSADRRAREPSLSFQEAGRVIDDGERPAFNKVKSAVSTALTDQGSESASYTYFRPRPQTTREISSFSIFFLIGVRSLARSCQASGEAQAALHRCAAEVPAMPTPITSSFAAAPIMRLCRSPPLRLR